MGEKIAVVSGGSKGIGKAICEAFASQGYSIITCGRSEEALLTLKEEIKQKFGLKVLLCVADLGLKEGRNTFVNFIKENTKHIDVLVNNTGQYIPGEILKEEEGVLEDMLQVNLLSAYDLTRGTIDLMYRSPKGHIFNICSTASIKPYLNGGSYCITKFAMLGMSKVVREELKESGVRVTSVLPGPVLTGSWDGVDLPETRFMTPEDIAKAVLEVYQLSSHTVVEELILRPQLGDI